MGKKKIVFGALVLVALLLVLSAIASAELTPPLPGGTNFVDKDIEEAHAMLEENPGQIILLDVRTEGEYRAEYIPGAMNIPLSDLEDRIDELDKSKAIIVYCQSGGKSRTASETLAQHGFVVYNMLGGLNAWKEKFATSVSTPMPTVTPTLSPAVTLTPSPAVSPSPSPIASPSPSLTLTPTPTTPTATPEEEEKRVPGFEVIFGITALSLLAWYRLKRSAVR